MLKLKKIKHYFVQINSFSFDNSYFMDLTWRFNWLKKIALLYFWNWHQIMSLSLTYQQLKISIFLIFSKYSMELLAFY